MFNTQGQIALFLEYKTHISSIIKAVLKLLPLRSCPNHSKNCTPPAPPHYFMLFFTCHCFCKGSIEQFMKLGCWEKDILSVSKGRKQSKCVSPLWPVAQPGLTEGPW